MLEQDKISRIKVLLKLHPRGLTITEISQRLKLNRNSVAKYMEIMLISGQVEAHSYGVARVFFLARRIPISAMLSASSDLVVTLDENRKVVFVNDNFLDFLNITREDAVGRHIVEIYGKDIQNIEIANLFADMLAGQDLVRETTLRKGNEEFFFRIKSLQTVFDDGCRGVTIVMENVTQEARYRAELEADEARYREVVESQTELISRFLPDGTHMFCNEAYYRYFGLTRDQVIGSRFKPEIPPDERNEIAAHFASLTRENPVGASVHRVILSNGDVRWQRWNDLAVFGPDGKVREYQSVGRDITEQRRLQEEEKRHLSSMEFLLSTAMGLATFPDEKEIYEYIGESIKAVVPEAHIFVLEYEGNPSLLRFKYASNPAYREVIRQHLGFDPGDGLPLTEEAKARIANEDGVFFRETEDLHELVFRMYPRDACERIKEEHNLGKLISASFSWRGALLGTAAIMLPRGVALKDKDMIKTLILQSSVALQRRQESITVRESEQRFRKITELSPFPIAISSTSGRYIYLNPLFTETFGYTLDDLRTMKDWFRLAFPDVSLREKAISRWNADLRDRETGKIRSYEFPVTCRDGTRKEVVFRTVRESDTIQFTVCEDITMERRAEEVRVLLSSIVQSCDDAIIGKKVDGTVITWNPAAERIYGYTADEIIGRSISLVVPPDHKEELNTILSEIEMGKHIQHFETKRIRKDGTQFDASITASPIVDSNGVVIGASSIVRDITPVKAEARLKEGEEKYRALVEDLDIGVYRSTGDPLGRFVWGNSNLVRILGYSSFEDLQGVAVSNLFLYQQGRKRLLDELREKGFVKDREIFLKRKDGSPLAVSVTAFAKFSPVGDILCVTGIVVDISDRKHAEEEFAEARQQMGQLTELLPDPAMITDRGGHVIAWNQAMERFTGVKKKEIIGNDGYKMAFSRSYGEKQILIDLLDTVDAETRFPGITRSGESLVRKTVVHEAASGKEISVVEKASALYNENGARIGGFLSIHHADEWESIVASLHSDGNPGQ